MLMSCEIAGVDDTPTDVTVTGVARGRRLANAMSFIIVLRKNVAEETLMDIYRGEVTVSNGIASEQAKRLISHLAATGQLRAGVNVVV